MYFSGSARTLCVKAVWLKLGFRVQEYKNKYCTCVCVYNKYVNLKVNSRCNQGPVGYKQVNWLHRKCF